MKTKTTTEIIIGHASKSGNGFYIDGIYNGKNYWADGDFAIEQDENGRYIEHSILENINGIEVEVAIIKAYL